MFFFFWQTYFQLQFSLMIKILITLYFVISNETLKRNTTYFPRKSSEVILHKCLGRHCHVFSTYLKTRDAVGHKKTTCITNKNTWPRILYPANLEKRELFPPIPFILQLTNGLWRQACRVHHFAFGFEIAKWKLGVLCYY